MALFIAQNCSKQLHIKKLVLYSVSIMLDIFGFPVLLNFQYTARYQSNITFFQPAGDH